MLDLAGGSVPPQQIQANSGVAFQITRVAGKLSITAQTVAITSVVNSAGSGPGLSPGELSRSSAADLRFNGGDLSTCSYGFRPCSIGSGGISISDQRANSYRNSRGDGSLQVSSALGTANQPISIYTSAPGIFVIGAAQAAILNQDGTINSTVDAGTTRSVYFDLLHWPWQYNCARLFRVRNYRSDSGVKRNERESVIRRPHAGNSGVISG